MRVAREERPQSFLEDIKKVLESVASVEVVGERASGEEAVYRSFIYSGSFEHRNGNASNLKPFGELLRMAANARLRLFSHILRYC